jgi:hypothetical protein
MNTCRVICFLLLIPTFFSAQRADAQRPNYRPVPRPRFVAPFPGPVTTIDTSSLWGVPTFLLNGASWIMKPAFGTYWPRHQLIEDFEQAGSKVYVFTTTPSRSDYNRASLCWTAPNVWKYSGFGLVDSMVYEILIRDPDAVIFFRLDMGTPDWWLNDPANAPELEKLYNGWTVSDTPFGVAPRQGPFPSLASAKWRNDMKTCLTAFVNHIKASYYKDNIGGFIITGMATDEWYHFGSGTDKFWGYGDRTVQSFRAWLSQKYGTDFALQSAWNNPSVTLATATPPGYWDRKDEGLMTTFRNPAAKMPVIDFLKYWNELIPETINVFATHLKEATQGSKVVGGMYGYLNEFSGDPEFGHNGLYKYLGFPAIDFLFSCTSYGNRAQGGGSYTRSAHNSVALHGKLLFHEMDTATYLTRAVLTDVYGIVEPTLSRYLADLAYTDTFDKNKQMLRRDAGFNLCHGTYYDFFDLHGWYYDADDLMGEVATLNAFASDNVNYDRSSVAEILVVTDETSCYYPLARSTLLRQATYEPMQQLIKTGAPYDHVLLDDLGSLNTARYKMVLFLNCFNMSDAQRNSVANKLKNNHRLLVWCYAPGLFNGTSMSATNMHALTGFNLAISSSETYHAPRITIRPSLGHPLAVAIANKGFYTFGPTASSCKRITVQDTTSTTLGRYAGTTSLVNMAYKNMGDWRSLYCSTASLPAGVFREIARYAGVSLFLDNAGNDTLYANKSFVTIHAATAGSKTLDLPGTGPYSIYDAITGDWLANANTFTRSFAAGETFIYRYQ